MSAPRADRADCIGMIGAAMVELLAIASREDLQAAMAFWCSPESANAWNAIECIRLVDAKLEAHGAHEGPCLGPM